jgi:AhpD family alkylhydroperoxidase
LLLARSTKNGHFLIISENTSEGEVPVDVIKTYGSVERKVIQLLSFLTSAIDGGKCVNVHAWAAVPPGKNPDAIQYEVEQKTQ